MALPLHLQTHASLPAPRQPSSGLEVQTTQQTTEGTAPKQQNSRCPISNRCLWDASMTIWGELPGIALSGKPRQLQRPQLRQNKLAPVWDWDRRAVRGLHVFGGRRHKGHLQILEPTIVMGKFGSVQVQGVFFRTPNLDPKGWAAGPKRSDGRTKRG
ncbi:hypothetical protein B0H10DRAFT_2190763 [Mycena sp. CBHHK59/15]|nr:hypothetical protein B0H10DRAFT_2190760 [Mycena sp. CBHHK59/15]KAJ6615921.1 hypothetical protein B0H10DRAFT_2190763 [Mycena sp. CBHHK59/15]